MVFDGRTISDRFPRKRDWKKFIPKFITSLRVSGFRYEEKEAFVFLAN